MWTELASAATLMAVPKTEFFERRALRRGFPREVSSAAPAASLQSSRTSSAGLTASLG